MSLVAVAVLLKMFTLYTI